MRIYLVRRVGEVWSVLESTHAEMLNELFVAAFPSRVDAQAYVALLNHYGVKL